MQVFRVVFVDLVFALTGGEDIFVLLIGLDLIFLGSSAAAGVGIFEVGESPGTNEASIAAVKLCLSFKPDVSVIDANGETGTELEEMFLLTTSLPGDLQLKVGQFFSEFGRQNIQHPHAWGFADQPLVLNRMFGPDGLRSQGARVSWLLPTPFYTEAMLGVMNSARGRQVLQEPLVTLRNGRYVLPVKADFRGEFRGIMHDMSSSGATNGVSARLPRT